MKSGLLGSILLEVDLDGGTDFGKTHGVSWRNGWLSNLNNNDLQ